jgi:hypothetical protein
MQSNAVRQSVCYAIMFGNDLTPRWLRLLPVALLLSACGGGDNQAGLSQSPILQVGMQRQYNSQMTTTVAQSTVVESDDETSNVLGGGPYTETTTTNTSYTAADWYPSSGAPDTAGPAG